MDSDFWGSLDAMSVKDQGITTMKAVPATNVEDQSVKDQDTSLKVATASEVEDQPVKDQDRTMQAAAATEEEDQTVTDQEKTLQAATEVEDQNVKDQDTTTEGATATEGAGSDTGTAAMAGVDESSKSHKEKKMFWLKYKKHS